MYMTNLTLPRSLGPKLPSQLPIVVEETDGKIILFFVGPYGRGWIEQDAFIAFTIDNIASLASVAMGGSSILRACLWKNLVDLNM